MTIMRIVRKITLFACLFILVLILILLTAIFAADPIRTWWTKNVVERAAAWGIGAGSAGGPARSSPPPAVRGKVDPAPEPILEPAAVPEPAAAPDSAESPESSASAESSEPEKANKKYAILVGVNDYEVLYNLRFAVNDINLIRDQLQSMGFERDHIFTLSSESDMANTPTRAHIMDRINRVLKEAGPNDMIFLALAGHGVQIGENIYFCPQDTRNEIEWSAVSITGIIKRLEKCPARFKWMVIDACRNNPFKDRAGHPNTRGIQKIDNPPKGLIILQSCAENEESYEDEEFGHGIFSYNFVEGLKGGADADKDGNLTLTEVCKYTIEKTVDMSMQRFHKNQHPYMTGELSDFIIADDLLIDGITREEWQKAESLYQDACLSRERGELSEALVEISEAIEITEEAFPGSARRKIYLNEEKRLTEAIAGQLAKEAADLFDEGDYTSALGKIDESLAMNDTEMSQRFKRQIEEKIANPGTAPTDETPIFSSGQWENVSPAIETKTLTVKDVEFTFCWCPEGSFTMGSSDGEVGRYDDETEHRVTLSRGFWLLETEVTQRMWKNVMGENPSKNKGDDLPVECVSRSDCQKFIDEFNTVAEIPEGYEASLPTEARWEYACRAGSTGPYAGTGKLAEMGWYLGNSGKKTHEVKEKKPNAWGLYDMHGNVCEWCLDWKDDYAKSSAEDPEGPESGTFRVLRGGSWSDYAENCRSARRWRHRSTYRSETLGFRLALVPSE